ncbi:hypothetical protein [Curtobacterium sp. MCBD17_040]|uniref:hypothetical protein n=1 Tax=Curtobacterium sp. MCBD17_040 TaxID=2175674 RepID=UPI000DA702A0|nr:hypothetical protein [Curtobacterium sp. MCBD17_040]WIB65301.1 hypothetical protein DEI94_18010 [Curtobacterium sp. MCBD17_040]
MRDDKEFVVARVAQLIAANYGNTATPTYNDYALASYLYANGVGFPQCRRSAAGGRRSAAGGQALRNAASTAARYPQSPLEHILGALAASTADAGHDEEAHALREALAAWTAAPSNDGAQWLIARSVQVETGGED